MPHDTPLITTIVAGLVLAFVFGAIANRLRMPPLVGYLIAGVVAGPYTPGLVADAEMAHELAEIGVILLMFGVGLNFSLKDLVSVQAVAIPGALLRIAVGTLMGLGLGLLMGWTLGAGLIFGLALSIASTVVVLKALHDRHLIDSDRGRIAVGWVIVEDVVTVIALVLIPALASVWGTAIVPDDPFVRLVERVTAVDLGTGGVIAVTVVKLAAFVGFMLVVGRRLIPMILHYTAHTGSRELFRLAVLAIALGVAVGAAFLFGVSLALGAFFAGMILSESQLSQRAAQESLPFRDAFAVLFFVSVGMLFDPMILVHDPWPMLATLFIVLVGKSAVGFLFVIALRRPVGTALTVSAGLAQIGEFSFILATLGLSLGLLETEARDLIVGGAIISIVVNPLLFLVAERVRPVLEARFKGVHEAEADERLEPALGPVATAEPAEEEEEIVHPTALTAHTVLIGYGRVGSVIATGLKGAGRPFLVIEDAEDRVAAARAQGIEVIEGNAAGGKLLDLANVEGAQTVVITIPNAFEAGHVTTQCRRHNPGINIIARAHSDEEEHYLHQLGAGTVILGEREIGEAMLELATHDPNIVAKSAAMQAMEAAIMPSDATPQRTLRREARVLSGIDEAELARAMGVPSEPPVASPPPAIETPLVSETVVEVEPEAPASAAEPAPEPPDVAEPAPEPEASAPAAEGAPAKPARQPATTAATPFGTGEPG